jgi:hypothetical protein
MLKPKGRATAGRGMMMLRLFSVIPTVRAFLFSATLVFGLCFSGIASAQLSINVEGVPGFSTSVWTFSGSYSVPAVNGSPFGPLNVAGAFDLVSNGGLGTVSGQMNNWQGADWTSAVPFLDLGPANIAFAPGIIAHEATGVFQQPAADHNVQSFLLENFPRATWFADGAWAGDDSLTFSGSAVAQFDVALLNQIVGVGDSQIVTATTPTLGNLTMTFTAVPVPEPSSALLIGLGLAAMGASKRRRAGIAASV